MESTNPDQAKTMKPTISRTFTMREPKRYITIHYDYDRINKVLKYGASIHFMDNDKEKFNKSGHQETAQKRFKNRPITITNFISDKDTGIFHRTIRQQLHSYGTKSPREELKTYELVKVPVFKQKKTLMKPSPPMRNKKGKKTSDTQVKKEMKPVISRMMSVKEFNGNTKRIVTIQYKYDRINEKLEYGATIYKSPSNILDKYDREGHKKTALARFQKHPITIENFTDKDGQQMFNTRLRNLLHKHGVQNKTQ